MEELETSFRGLNPDMENFHLMGDVCFIGPDKSIFKTGLAEFVIWDKRSRFSLRPKKVI